MDDDQERAIVDRERDLVHRPKVKTETKRGPGFASMSADRVREIAGKGGKAAHAKGRAHKFTSDEARIAGRRGGKAVSRDREHMAVIGRLGARSRIRAALTELAGDAGASDCGDSAASDASDAARG